MFSIIGLFLGAYLSWNYAQWVMVSMDDPTVGGAVAVMWIICYLPIGSVLGFFSGLGLDYLIKSWVK